jgi:hypothetical protein
MDINWFGITPIPTNTASKPTCRLLNVSFEDLFGTERYKLRLSGLSRKLFE